VFSFFKHWTFDLFAILVRDHFGTAGNKGTGPQQCLTVKILVRSFKGTQQELGLDC
jgi:hypothetical protein